MSQLVPTTFQQGVYLNWTNDLFALRALLRPSSDQREDLRGNTV
jgi:hypothetical protein